MGAGKGAAIVHVFLPDGINSRVTSLAKEAGVSSGENLQMIGRFLPGGDTQNGTIWWFDAFYLMLDGLLGKSPLDPSFGEPMQLSEKEMERPKITEERPFCFFWGSSKFIGGFFKEIATWNCSEPVLWSDFRYDAKSKKTFQGSLGVLLPGGHSYDLRGPNGLGNRFFIRHMRSELSRLGLPFDLKGNMWPSPKEELTETKGKSHITLAMIAKDEERFLAGCLEQALPFVDRIVVVDTGSLDRTKEIAIAYGASVVDYVWDNDFAGARNAYLNAIENQGFVMTLDADEFLTDEAGANLRRRAESRDKGVFLLNTLNYGGSFGRDLTSQANIRLFWYDRGVRYSGKIHEQLLSSRKRTMIRGPYVVHYGYLPKVSDLKAKKQRNLGLLREMTDPSAGASCDPFSWFNLGWQFLNMNRPKDSLSALEKYFGLEKPEILKLRPSAYWFASQAALSCGKPDLALEYAEISCRSALPEAFFARAQAWIEMGQMKEAMDDLKRAANGSQTPSGPYEVFNQRDPSVWLWKARCGLGSVFEKQGKMQDAEEQYRLASEKAPYEADVILSLARVKRLQLCPEESLVWAEKGLEKYPKHVSMNLEYAFDLASLGRFQDAVRHLDRLPGFLDSSEFSLEKKNKAYLAVVEMALAQKRVQEAEDILKSMPENPGVKQCLGNLYLEEKRFDEAEKCLRQALEMSETLSDEWAECRLALAKTLVFRGRIEEALELVAPIPESEGDLPFGQSLTSPIRMKASLLAARCLNSLKRYREALEVLSQVDSLWEFEVRVSGGDQAGGGNVGEKEKAEWHLVAGNAYFGLEDPDKAADEYFKAYEMDPNEPELLKRIGLLMMRLNRWEDAENALYGYLKFQPEDQMVLSLYQTVLAMRKAAGF